MKPLLFISCPVETMSGYGARSRDIIKAILKLRLILNCERHLFVYFRHCYQRALIQNFKHKGILGQTRYLLSF